MTNTKEFSRRHFLAGASGAVLTSYLVAAVEDKQNLPVIA